MTLSSLQLSDLRSRLEGDVTNDPAIRAMYATDASVYQILPTAVVRPRHRDDVAAVLAFCREHDISITARGGGTSQAGQAIGSGLQLDFSKHFGNLLELQPDRQRVRVQPGIVLDELNATLKPYGLTLPLDLSTSSRATIGGMISNNSSGTRSVVYGKTLDYVESLTVMLADGSVVVLDESSPDASDTLHARCHDAVVSLATKHSEEIDRRYPKILRRVGGYNLDEFTPEHKRPPNLARLIVGSEGTLALILEATLRVVPIPAERVLLSVQFDDLLEALAAVPTILEHDPSAIELVDRMILSHTIGKPEFEPLRWFIDGDPAGVLLIEVQGEDTGDLLQRIETIESDLKHRGWGTSFFRAVSPEEQGRIWKLRKASLGLSMAVAGDEKAIAFVEDTAVAPARLRDYIQRFREILDRHHTPAGFYAHASVGLLHIRPVVDLKTTTGVERFSAIANDVADLVLEFGGALSGEHGDGLVRAPFQERMFGPTLYQAFREIKRTFDPEGLLNPGKIVDAPELTADLRFGPGGHVTPAPTTVFDFSDFGGIARAAEQCSGVGACRKSLTGTMCPSYMATRNESDSTRGRANALRMAINGQLGPEGIANPTLKPALDLCLECKACKSECPTGVDMARMKSEFLYQFHQVHSRPRHDRRFADIRNTLERASTWPRLFNAVSSSRIGKWVAGIAQDRKPPRVATRSLLAQCKHLESPSALEADAVFFPDTFSIHYEPQHVLAAIRVASSLGLSSALSPHVCCGRPLISRGFLDEARSQATRLVDALIPLAQAQRPIIFLEPGCWSAAIDDLPQLVPAAKRQAARQVARACLTFEQWASRVLPDELRPVGPPGDAVLHHAHCHQKALIGTSPTLDVIRQAGGKAKDLDGGCCGMAGSFGYQRDHLAVSLAIGERVLAPAVRQHRGPVIAPGFSCRHQVEHLTGTQPLSTAQWLADRLAP